MNNNRVVDHRSREPVLSPLHSCVDRCHVWRYWASGCKPWRWMLKVISMHGPIWVGFGDLKHVISFQQLPLYSVEQEMQHCWVLISHETCIECRQPELRCMELRSWVSMRFVYLDLALTGQQYSATKWQRTKAEVWRVFALAPHEVPTCLAIRLFRLFSFAALCVRCCLYLHVNIFALLYTMNHKKVAVYLWS